MSVSRHLSQPGIQPLSPAASERSASAAVVDMQAVNLTFGRDVGVFDLNLQVPPGTIFGLIGPSGSGKTTTVRLLTGLYRPDHGQVYVLGCDTRYFNARIRERIGYMPQQFVLYPNLTTWENLNFVASLYGLGYRRRKRLKHLLEFVELYDVRRRLGSQLSGGMQRRLLLACALTHDPALLFADEPTAGIDPVLRAKFWSYFRSLRDAGRTLVITTQYVGEAAYCDLVGVMREGRLIHIDTPEGLRRTALGGDVIKVVVEATHTTMAAQILYQHPAVHDVRRARRPPGTLYVYVEHAGKTLPTLINAFDSYPDITINQIEEFQPPYDEVFITLMEQANTNHA